MEPRTGGGVRKAMAACAAVAGIVLACTRPAPVTQQTGVAEKVYIPPGSTTSSTPSCPAGSAGR